jgi:hypothetical protein
MCDYRSHVIVLLSFGLLFFSGKTRAHKKSLGNDDAQALSANNTPTTTHHIDDTAYSNTSCCKLACTQHIQHMGNYNQANQAQQMAGSTAMGRVKALLGDSINITVFFA